MHYVNSDPILSIGSRGLQVSQEQQTVVILIAQLPLHMFTLEATMGFVLWVIQGTTELSPGHNPIAYT